MPPGSCPILRGFFVSHLFNTFNELATLCKGSFGFAWHEWFSWTISINWGFQNKVKRGFSGFSLFMSAYFGYSNGRRGEEHSFILKPDTSAWKLQKAQGQISQSSHLPVEEKRITLTSDQYAVFVSCRCNYTGIYTCSWSTIYLNPFRSL